MNDKPSYRKSFYWALGFHLCIIALLVTESSSQKAVLNLDATPQLTQTDEHKEQKPQELIKAVSVNNDEVMEAMSRIKEERVRKERQEIALQQKRDQQLRQAKRERIKEQQRLKKLKEEADQIALARKKQIKEEKQRLKKMAEERAKEAQRLAELKKQKEKIKAQQEQLKKQQQEAKRLAQLKQKKAEEEANAKRLAAQRAQAARDAAARQAQISGEVNKYKALIVNAISRQWILPDNVDSSLSSKFRIRLAPDGMVLDVSLIRSSGDPVLDRSAQTAIFKASPLPVPSDTEAFNLFRDISLTVRPEQVRG